MPKGKKRQNSRKIIFRPNNPTTYRTMDFALAENPDTGKSDWLIADSKGEYERFCYLLDVYAKGEISELYFHPEYILMPPFRLKPNILDPKGKAIRKIGYTADFSYIWQGILIVEDFKAYNKKRDEAWIEESAKRSHKLLQAQLRDAGDPFHFRIVVDPRCPVDMPLR